MSDVDLLAERAAGGDFSALGDLVHHLAPRLRGYLVKRGISYDEIEEQSQRIWLKIAEKITDSYDPKRGNGFVPWMLAVARNLVTDHYRRRGGGEPLSDVEIVSDHVREVARCELVASAMKSLPPEQRRLLRLRYWDGMSVKEVSQHLGEEYSATKARVHRAQVAFTNEVNRISGGSISSG